LGTRNNLGIRSDLEVRIPVPIVNEYFKGENVVDYSVGENSSVILTDKNKVFWSGMGLAYKPI